MALQNFIDVLLYTGKLDKAEQLVKGDSAAGLCWAVLCCAVLCCAVLCCAVPCRAVLCCACRAVSCHAVPCCAVPCHARIRQRVLNTKHQLRMPLENYYRVRS